MSKGSARLLRVRKHDAKYQPIGHLGLPCIYCGEPSDTWDHIPPLVTIEGATPEALDGMELVKLPACAECNGVLGDRLFLSIPDRKAHIAEFIKRRYVKYLNMPGWDDDELAELSRELARYVRASHKTAQMAKRRLSFARGLIADEADVANSAPMLRVDRRRKNA